MASLPRGLESIFKDLGLTESEITVMLFLVRSDIGLRATEIARKTKLNRTTLYGLLKSLVEKGLVTSSEEHGVMRFRSIDPDLLVAYIERAQERLAADVKQMTELLPAITHARKTHEGYYPQIQFFGGVEGIKQAYEDTIKNNPDKKTYGFVDYHSAIQNMDPEWPPYYIKKRTAAGVTAYTIASDTDQSREMHDNDDTERRVTKFFPKGYEFNLEIVTYGDKTMMVSFDKEHPLAVIITDEKIAGTIKTLFRYIDDTLPTEEI